MHKQTPVQQPKIRYYRYTTCTSKLLYNSPRSVTTGTQHAQANSCTTAQDPLLPVHNMDKQTPVQQPKIRYYRYTTWTSKLLYNSPRSVTTGTQHAQANSCTTAQDPLLPVHNMHKQTPVQQPKIRYYRYTTCTSKLLYNSPRSVTTGTQHAQANSCTTAQDPLLPVHNMEECRRKDVRTSMKIHQLLMQCDLPGIACYSHVITKRPL